MKIGIPNSLFYHKYGYLWKKFFDYLGISLIARKSGKETDFSFDIKNNDYKTISRV